MFIANLFENYVKEDNGPEVVVIYPGRFQPFHLGHKEVFTALQNKYGRDNVYIATSNKTEGARSPFNFSDKNILMNAAGIPDDRIIEVANPYKLPDQFNAEKTIYIVVVGSPDRNRLNPDSTKKDGTESYFKTLDKLQGTETADKHGYVIIADERNKTITLGNNTVDVSHGTQARAAWNAVRNDPQLRSQFLKQMYGRDDAELGRVLDKIPSSVNEEAAGVGVIANKKQAKDPRYSTSLTVDIKPGQDHKEAKKLRLAEAPTPNVATGIRGKYGGYGQGEADTFATAKATGDFDLERDIRTKMIPARAAVDRATVARTGNIAPTLDQEVVLPVSAPDKLSPDADKAISNAPANSDVGKLRDMGLGTLPGTDTLQTGRHFMTNKGQLERGVATVNNFAKPARDVAIGAMDTAQDAMTRAVQDTAAAADQALLQKQGRTSSPNQQPKSYIESFARSLDEIINEKWSAKYKRSINCKNPKGFSQRAHCQGRKK